MKPQETIKETASGTEVDIRHPAMGLVEVSRYSSNGTRLFGSEITHHHYINITVKRAQVTRRLSRDWIHGEERIVEFSLSTAQWAHLVASIGMAEGTPVTLQHAPVEGTPIHRLPDFERDPVSLTFAKEVSDAARVASEGVVRVQKLLDDYLKPGAKGPKKSDLEQIREELRHAGEHFQGTMTYVTKCFKEAMEEATEAAKTEVEGFVSGIAQRTGLETLKQSALPSIGEHRPSTQDDHYLPPSPRAPTE